ncbi:hypothetical protein FRB96_000258 [Tulasnella sp. 330]|nr:hypothetical protein FRB96_000258 [Tulasnella sp. 330]
MMVAPAFNRNMLPNVLACRLILDLREQGSYSGNNWITDGDSLAIIDFFKPRFPTPPEPTPPLSTMQFKQPTRPFNSDDTADNSYASGSGAGSEEGVMVVARDMGKAHGCRLSANGRETTEGDLEAGVRVGDITNEKVERFMDPPVEDVSCSRPTLLKSTLSN